MAIILDALSVLSGDVTSPEAVSEFRAREERAEELELARTENGYITVDTLQSIYKLGVQNLAYLQDENGQLVINEANIQKVIAARTQQMAIETALNYIQQLRTALTNQDTAALQNLIFATDVAAILLYCPSFAEELSLPPHPVRDIVHISITAAKTAAVTFFIPVIIFSFSCIHKSRRLLLQESQRLSQLL